ncbi:hypothetical protein BDV24DRAFT_158738 [Aspergillus arachidicola]|uniref:Uncharacterized protein n=1 Tax=Aspergillus arachidicola TaxID=656916 RepID=A0A5N6YLY4_9EURO|nr:hypothetical protein BDV24DRAFT_158738 [Aspergillus arachidicola]
MKLSAILFVFFAGAIMAAPVPDNSIHERGIITPSTPIEERGIAGGLVKERGLGLKKPVVERARLTPSVPIVKRGEALVKKPIAERGAARAGAGAGGEVKERGYGRPLAERGISFRPASGPDVLPDVVTVIGGHE